MSKIGNKRLLNVAKALRDAAATSQFTFTMGLWAHDCNTPACAFGHYAARNDLQHTFHLAEDPTCEGVTLPYTNHANVEVDTDIREDHFDINWIQDDELFGLRGCGNASTPIEAAQYIENFVAARS